MITFIIPGRPVPKGRPRLGVRGRRAYIYTLQVVEILLQQPCGTLPPLRRGASR